MNLKSFNQLYQLIVENGYDFGTGSWSAMNPKIKMEMNSQGEYHPILKSDQSLTSSELKDLEMSCLSLNPRNEKDISDSLFSQVPNIKYNKYLGYYSGLYAGHVNVGNFRENGSSGGIGTWILTTLLEKRLIDKVIQVKRSQKADCIFEYSISTTPGEISEGSGTKYYPVEYSEVIREMKRTPGAYAIIGLPSYIVELRLMAEMDPVVRDRLKFTVGLICGHQKSAKFAEFLAWQCGIEPGNLKSINFRKKQKGLPSSEYAIEVVGIQNGREIDVTKPMKELVGGNWGEGLFKVRASDFTDDVMNETADITLGDAWLPEYTKDDKGNNVIIVRNAIIQQIFNDAIKEGTINADSVSEETIYASQAGHFRHTQKELVYRLYKNQRKGIWIPKKRVQPSKNISWTRRRIQDVREQICLEIPTEYLVAVKNNNLSEFIRKVNKVSRKYKVLYLIQRVIHKLKRT